VCSKVDEFVARCAFYPLIADVVFLGYHIVNTYDKRLPRPAKSIAFVVGDVHEVVLAKSQV
jgi:hypothetical protein